MTTIKVGVQFRPQDTSVELLRTGWKAADELGVDSMWVWDHFFPIYGDPDVAHFEAYSLLAAMAVDTSHAQIGALVTGNGYRNPDLLADMSRTIDHLSGGRFVLGLGAGWFDRDYDEYGYEFGTGPSRLRLLQAALPRITARLAKLNPPPVGPLPILIGGGGEKVTLKLVAQYADMWNGFGPAENFAAKSAVLDEWCATVGRDPATIERSVLLGPEVAAGWRGFVGAGATHLIFSSPSPFDLEPVRDVLAELRG